MSPEDTPNGYLSVLVDKDVLTCPVAEIHTAKPEATYFEGKKVYPM